MKIKQWIPLVMIAFILFGMGILVISNQAPSAFSAKIDDEYVYLPVVVNESDGSPNETSTPTGTPTTTPTHAPVLPDLIIGPPQLVSTPPINAYESVNFSVVITNTGGIDINQQFFVDLYFDLTDVFTNYIPITNSVGFSAMSSLQGGASQIITITAPLGFENLPDPHTVYGMVDSLNGGTGGQIAEPIESNNVSLPTIITNVIPLSTLTTPPTVDSSGSDSIAGKALIGARVKRKKIGLTKYIVRILSTLSTVKVI